MRFVFVFLAFLPLVLSMYAQDSDQKEEILSARARAARADEVRSECLKLGSEAIRDNECYGFYPPQTITWGRGFAGGLAKVRLKGKVGFIDKTGRLVIPARFSDAGRFSEGLAPFESSKGKWGFIDSRGRISIPAKFDWAISFHGGLALVQVGNRWGYINHTGKVVIEPKFEEASSFSEGFAVVGYYDSNYVWTSHKRPNGKWVRRFIDKTGNWAIDRSFDLISRNFDGGMAIVSENIGYSAGVVSKDFIIDKDGRKLWELRSPSIHWFSEDAIVVEVERKPNGRSLYNYRDRTGKLLCDSNFEQAGDFSEGVASVRVVEQYGFINKLCQFELKPQFASAGNFSEGLASAGLLGSKQGFIDRRGNWVIPPRFRWVSNFSDGFALVLDGMKAGYIDRQGKLTWTPTQ